MIFSREVIDGLKKLVEAKLSKPRYLHTLGVAKAASCLAEFCLPEYSSELEAAALLHDITKEYTHERQLEIIKYSADDIDIEAMESPQILHAFTAKAEILTNYPQFATENVLSAVYNHTIGSPDMTIFDEIIFLADFIEETRKYEASIAVREYVFLTMKKNCIEENRKILHIACIKAIDYTVLHLIDSNRKINSKNILTRNALLSKI